MTLAELRNWAADDFLAATHQSMGQYRTALLRVIDELASAQQVTPQEPVSLTDDHLKVLYTLARMTNVSDWIAEARVSIPDVLAPSDSAETRDWKTVPTSPTDDMCAAGLREQAASNGVFHIYQKMVDAAPAATHEQESTIGVGNGSGNLFVHGSYEAIRRVRSFIFDAEKWRSHIAAPAATRAGDATKLLALAKSIRRAIVDRDHIQPGIEFAELLERAAILAAPAQGAQDDDILERFKNPMTPYGMLVRALRIVSGTLLMDMARDLQTTPGTLSAYEFGRKPIPQELSEHAANFFARNGIPDTLCAIRAAMSREQPGDSDAS